MRCRARQLAKPDDPWDLHTILGKWKPSDFVTPVSLLKSSVI